MPGPYRFTGNKKIEWKPYYWRYACDGASSIFFARPHGASVSVNSIASLAPHPHYVRPNIGCLDHPETSAPGPFCQLPRAGRTQFTQHSFGHVGKVVLQSQERNSFFHNGLH